jgi:carbamate kinase
VSIPLSFTHGNGPQVGSEQASDQVPAQTLGVCGVASQGEIGYLLSQSVQAELFAGGLKVPVASGVTQTVVRRDDPAML